jgi:hypothetical protein
MPCCPARVISTLISSRPWTLADGTWTVLTRTNPRARSRFTGRRCFPFTMTPSFRRASRRNLACALVSFGNVSIATSPRVRRRKKSALLLQLLPVFSGNGVLGQCLLMDYFSFNAAELRTFAWTVLRFSMTIGPSIRRGFSFFFGLINDPSTAALSRGSHPVRPGTLSSAIG